MIIIIITPYAYNVHKLCFLAVRIFAPPTPALTTASVIWDTLTKNTFVSAQLATQEKIARKVTATLNTNFNDTIV